jgi:hypothetical protein
MRSELEIGNDPAGIRYCVLLDDCTRHWRTDDTLHVLENYWTKPAVSVAS